MTGAGRGIGRAVSVSLARAGVSVPDVIGAALRERFVRSHAESVLITAERSAEVLLGHLAGHEMAQIWDVPAQPEAAR
jgi:NAD(P)-dependent dehydrogenase (short-subunit alcohol dehydrogenase family)